MPAPVSSCTKRVRGISVKMERRSKRRKEKSEKMVYSTSSLPSSTGVEFAEATRKVQKNPLDT